MTFIKTLSPLKLSGKTIVIPVVSTANVAQLAADLLIASLGLERVAVFDSRYGIPLVGSSEDGVGITTAFELYGCETSEILVFQQRCPPLRNRKQEFIDEVLAFLRQAGVSGCLFLSGVDSSNRTDNQMFTPIYQLQSPMNKNNNSLLSRLAESPMPTYTSPMLRRPGDSNDGTQIPFIPGGGLTRRFLLSLPREWSIYTAAILMFAMDGDNRADAHLLASAVVTVLGLESNIKEWKEPESWNQGLFGTPHDSTLYG
ncbi:hypothetical protein E1B28_000714 [Marasmius oreades]|uniref:Proteasome assembly chaperone 2 n=1 Tax=Marasmius oreades TaxID=181124 RepID=A0A9P7V208_9AGAR|nr:uncharacterized protein E1B28_000714 [Marasmius oreades]KAG7098809.1 hypothetical protein E1B28_000714 [Marasmius oreades]